MHIQIILIDFYLEIRIKKFNLIFIPSFILMK